MTRPEQGEPEPRRFGGLSRREAMAYTAAFGSAFLAARGLTAQTPDEASRSEAALCHQCR